MLRSSTPTVKWDFCIFCQDTNLKESVSSVTTLKMSEQILDLSKYDQEVHVRLAVAHSFQRIDVLFDRYHEHSIKGGTRKRREKGSVAIRRPVTNRDLPLPAKWENFIAHQDNKTDLARFLSQQLILRAPANKTIVAEGGFSDDEWVEASDPTFDTDSLEAKHEEADTRIILHCIRSRVETIVVSARDTDVLILLIAYFHRMPCQQIWMKAGTAKDRKYIPIHAVVEKLQMEEEVLELLPGFHALTGSDSTSYIAGHTKKTCWNVFRQHSHLLKGLGEGPEFSDSTIMDAKVFFCKLYGAINTNNINEVRLGMFVKGMTIERLPPTRDALKFHIQRVHFQTLVWRQAHLQYPVLPPPENMEWKTMCLFLNSCRCLQFQMPVRS
ncbi:hypothetical protein Pcinc_010581 [Petrolisthes cinctipes]|uniref:Uncharacterized protein n=1 Tax=Petrolisthes cinctipes TaxID=88211 RepID=A0AAE1KUE0_PETCI|nr:hypothetical protein Pcinc_010581 [Petrolisthes cinctipes]